MTNTSTIREASIEISAGRIIKVKRGKNNILLKLIIHNAKRIEDLNAPNKEKRIIHDNLQRKKVVTLIINKGAIIKIYPLKGNQCQVLCYKGKNNVKLLRWSNWQRKKWWRKKSC